ncbi:MAG: HEAT repeat domain-containing protein [Planctomycetota bacterium]
MAIQVECGGCGKQSSAPDDWVGKWAKCPKCGAKVEIPTSIVAVEPVEPMADLLNEELGAGLKGADPMSDPFAAMSAPAATSFPAGGVTLRQRKAPRRPAGDGFAAWLLARKLSLAVAAAGCLAFLILAFLGAVTAGLVVGGIGILIAATGLSSRLAAPGPQSRSKPVDMSKFWGQLVAYLAVSVSGGLWLTRNFQKQEVRIGFTLFCAFISVTALSLGFFGKAVFERFGLFRIAAWIYLGLFALFLCVGFSGAFGTLAGDRASASAEADVEDERDTEPAQVAGADVGAVPPVGPPSPETPMPGLPLETAGPPNVPAPASPPRLPAVPGSSGIGSVAPAVVAREAELDQLLATLRSGETRESRLGSTLSRLAILAPSESRREEVAGLIDPFLTNSNSFVQISALRAVAVWGTARNMPTLLGLSDDPSHATTLPLISALKSIPDPRALEALVGLVADPAWGARAALALEEMGPAAEEAVITLLEHEDYQVRYRACNVLQKIGGEKSVAALREMLQRDKHAWSRAAAEIALRKLTGG